MPSPSAGGAGFGGLYRRRRRERWVDDSAVEGQQRGLDDLVRSVDPQIALVIHEERKKGQQVARVKLAGIHGDARRDIQMAEDLGPIRGDRDLAGPAALDI